MSTRLAEFNSAPGLLEPAAGSSEGTGQPSNAPAATWRSYQASAGSQPADGRALALALASLVEASLDAAVAPLRAELDDTRAALELAREDVGHLRAELEQARDRIRALEAPRTDSSDMRTGSPSANRGAEPLARHPT